MIATTSLSNTRLKKNLKHLRNVDVRIAIDVGIADGLFAQTAGQTVELAVAAILRANGIRNRNQSGVPDLEIEVSVRTFYEPVARKQVAVYRVETTLREKVELERLKAPSTVADTWRHRAEIKYAEVTPGIETAPVILNEVKLQIETFVADWRAANGFADDEDARGQARDDLQGLLETLGPVYQRILNDSGIFALSDLVDLGKDADEEAIVLAELQKRNAAFPAAKLKEWITEATGLLDN